MVKGGLKLKSELATPFVVKPIGDLILAHVWVDASVYHLDSTFSYLIPGNLSGLVEVGSLVSVPFHGREIIGCVTAIEATGTTSGYKSISKVIGNIPYLQPHLLALVGEAARRYAAHPFDLIRSAIPDRKATVEKEFLSHVDHSQPSVGRGLRQYLQLPPARPRSQLMAEKISQLSKSGGVLVVLPDSREVQSLSAALSVIDIKHIALDSALGKSEYLRNFLSARLGLNNIVIGTRSAVFAPVSQLASLIIYNEGSEHLYERRSPGWNARDVALLRGHTESLDIYCVGYSPSTDIARFIEEEWFEFKRTRNRVKVLTFPQVSGELIPSRAIPVIRKSLSEGPVLFLVPLKGYAQAIRCARCKTVSRCECGGAHEQIAPHSPITCHHCLTQVTRWKCVWCHHEQPSLSARGIERHQFEIGLLFPNTPTVISSSDHQVSDVSAKSIIISTPGMAPIVAGGYSAVVILEGNRFLNQPDMRSSERIREMYFSHASLVKSGAPVLLIQDEGNPISTALATWNPLIAISHDLQERKSLGLPPYVRTAMMTMETSEISRLKSALVTAVNEERLPASTKVLGPIPKEDKSSLILTVDVAHGDELIHTIHEFMRRRSAAKKALPSLRIDPYSLSR